MRKLLFMEESDLIWKTVGEVVAMLDSSIHVDAFRDVVITGVCFDTRQIKSGDLFVPFVGNVRDGHEFVSQAREMGAVATFWQKMYPIHRWISRLF